ncbi:Uncharacterized protein SCF082_LOCUS45125, partial [Durusdinium trenchii]
MAALPDDGPFREARSRVEDDLRKVEAGKKTRIDWGASKESMFGVALGTMSRERNEALQKVQFLEQQVKQLKAANKALEEKNREKAFSKKFSVLEADPTRLLQSGAKQQGHQSVCCTTCGADVKLDADALGGADRRSKRASTPTNRTPKIGFGSMVRIPAVQPTPDAATAPQVDQEFEADTPHSLLEAFIEKHQLPFHDDSEESEDGSAPAAAKFSRAQTRNLLDLVHFLQACVEQTATLSSKAKILDGTSSAQGLSVSDFYETMGNALTKLAPGTKHSTFWIVDHDNAQLVTQSHRKGREVRVPLDGEDDGIAGFVARSGRSVVLNNEVLGGPDCKGEGSDFRYNAKVDHLGSAREFLDTKSSNERFIKQSMAVIPVFGKPAQGGIDYTKPTAIVQLCKSASRSNPVRKRVFSDSEVLMLSIIAQQGQWVLRNTSQMLEMQRRDLMMKAILDFPAKAICRLVTPLAARKSEPAKIELLKTLEASVVSAMPHIKRCRLFCVGQRQGKPAIFWAPVKKSYDFDNNDDDWERMVRSICEINHGLVGHVVAEKRTLVLDQPYNDERFNGNIDLHTDGLCLVAAPLFEVKQQGSGRLLGVVQVSIPNFVPHERDDKVRHFCADLVPQISLTIALSQINPGQMLSLAELALVQRRQGAGFVRRGREQDLAVFLHDLDAAQEVVRVVHDAQQQRAAGAGRQVLRAQQVVHRHEELVSARAR